MISKRVFLSSIAAVCCGLRPVRSATSEAYPSHPITMVLPFSAGGPTDALARIVTARMQDVLGQSIIIENVTGAAGTIGVGRVARAAADGYTLSVGPMNSHVLTGAIYHLPFDLLRDFEPVALLASNPSVVVSKKDVPAKDLKELIAWVKANPDKVLAGTSGVGAATHLGGILFETLTDTHIQFVPYRGTAPAMHALVGGQIDLIFDQLSSSLPQLQEGTIKSYAVMSKTRAVAAPDIPTVTKQAYPAFIYRSGMECGLRRARRGPSSTNSTMPSWKALPTRPCASGSPKSAWKSIRATGKRRNGYSTIKRPRSVNGGRSSKPRVSKRNEPYLSRHRASSDCRRWPGRARGRRQPRSPRRSRDRIRGGPRSQHGIPRLDVSSPDARHAGRPRRCRAADRAGPDCAQIPVPQPP